jgi:hypothetical protein
LPIPGTPSEEASVNPVSFNAPTKTLFFVPDFFKAKKKGRAVTWRKGIRSGARIRKGTILGDIFWNDGDDDVIRSPVAGTILKTNGRIRNAQLQRSPPQFALVLK